MKDEDFVQRIIERGEDEPENDPIADELENAHRNDIMVFFLLVYIFVFVVTCVCAYNDHSGSIKASTPIVEESATEESAMLLGVDLSDWQSENFAKIIDRESYQFVVCRATESTYVDPVCDLAYQYAKSKGKLLGVYFLAYPKIHDAADYAKFCADTVEGYVGETVFMLDCEVDPSTGWILEWLQEFERITGTKPLVYTNLNTAEKLNWEGVINNGNKLWLAYYGYDDGTCHEIPDQVGTWPKEQIIMHQYTTSGLGERETLDLDVFFGDEEAWQALAAKKTN